MTGAELGCALKHSEAPRAGPDALPYPDPYLGGSGACWKGGGTSFLGALWFRDVAACFFGAADGAEHTRNAMQRGVYGFGRAVGREGEEQDGWHATEVLAMVHFRALYRRPVKLFVPLCVSFRPFPVAPFIADCRVRKMCVRR